MKVLKAECVMEDEAIVGESPVWCSKSELLYRVDITSKLIHRSGPNGDRHETFYLPHRVTGLALRATGGLVLSLDKDFAFYDLDKQELHRIGNPEPDKSGNRFNDASCDRQGRFWAGTMGDANWDAPVGALYCLDSDLQISVHQDQVICANGMGWSPDASLMYFTESFRYAVYVYDFDSTTGQISNRREFATLDDDAGNFPDGLTVDSEGFVWIVHNAGGKVVRYAQTGEVDLEVVLPVPRPCGCAFGGTSMDTLYISTARETLTPEQIAKNPLSGNVFAVSPGVQGIPEPLFAG